MTRLRLVAVGLSAVMGFALMSGSARAECTIGDCWGAVAFGSGGAWGYAVNHPSRSAAGEAASEECGSGCRVLTFHNSCAAYAAGSGGYGWGNASTREEAEETAMEQCRSLGGGCAVKVYGCTSR